MTRRALLHKWLIYALALIPIFLLDWAVLPRYPLFGVHPTLLPLAVAAVATLEGPIPGAGYGLATGLLWTTTYAGVSSLQVALLTLTGLLVGSATQYVLSQSIWGCLVCSAGALLVQEMLHILFFLFLRTATVDTLVAVAVPEFLWTFVWTAPIYLIYYLIYRKVGGTKLA